MKFKEGVNGDGLQPALLVPLIQAEFLSGLTFMITHVEDGLHVDIRCWTSPDRFYMLRALFRVGFRRIGVYDRHIHVDVSADKPQEVCWRGVSL